MRRIASIAALTMMLLAGGSAAAFAEAPPQDINKNITDNSGVLDTDRVKMVVQQVQNETDFDLFVYFTETLDGMNSAKWAVEAAENAGLDATKSVLYVVATKDREFGSAYPNGTKAASHISKIEEAAVDSLREGDWTGAVEAYGNELIDTAHGLNDAKLASGEKTDGAVAGFIGFIGWLIAIIAAIAVAGLGAIFGFKGIRKVKARNRQIVLYKEDFQKLQVTVPSRISTLDEEIQNASEKASFDEAMFGAKLLVDAKTNLQNASDILQKAIKKLAEVPERAKTLEDHADRLKAMTAVDGTVAAGEKAVTAAIAELEEIEKMPAQLREDLDGFAVKSKTLHQKLESSKKNLDGLNSRYDSAYVLEANDSVKEMEGSLTGLASAMARAEKALADSKLADAEDMVEAIETRLDQASKAHSGFISSVEEIKGFDYMRNRHIETVLHEIRQDTPENRHESILPLIKEAEVALRNIERIDSSKGNPDAEFEKMNKPVSNYHRKTAALVSVRRNVTSAKEDVGSIFKEAKNHYKLVSEGVRRYGISLSSAEKESQEQVAALLDTVFPAIIVKMNESSKHDIATAEEILAEAGKTLHAVTDSTRTIRFSIEDAKEEERRRKEEEERRRREEERRKREEKRRREEEERRERQRRNSYSSSSTSFGVGFGAGSSFGSSSFGGGGSFGGSGGSFGGGGSGGSF